MGPPSGVV